MWLNATDLCSLDYWDLEIQLKSMTQEINWYNSNKWRTKGVQWINCFIIFLEGHPRGLMGSLVSPCQAAMPTLGAPLTLTWDWTNRWKKRRKDRWAVKCQRNKRQEEAFSWKQCWNDEKSEERMEECEWRMCVKGPWEESISQCELNVDAARALALHSEMLQ